MKSLVVTLLMAVMAAVAAGMAWYYSPKNEISETNVKIGQPLLDGEAAYDTSDVYRITIERNDDEHDTVSRMELARVSGSWVIPDKNDFLASNAERISGVIDSLRDKKILDMPSDQQDDHEEFGVVELSEAGASRLGVGTRLTLEDSRRNPLSQIIIGRSAADPDQRFVRFPGQPQIYVIEFDNELLSTEFADWVGGDLLRFGNLQSQLQQLVESIEINYYFLDPRKSDIDEARTEVYKARIYPEGDKWLYDLWPANNEQGLDETPTVSGQEINIDTFRALFGEIFRFQLRDVLRKSPEAAQDLAEPNESSPASHFDWLKSRGYRHSGFDNGQQQFASLAGNIRLRYRNGNVDTLAIGDLAGLDMQNRTNINRYLLVTFGVDDSVLPEPVRPTTDDDDALREYQRQLNERNQMLDMSNKRARSLNQVHADWLYVITQDAVSNLFPSMETLSSGPGGDP